MKKKGLFLFFFSLLTGFSASAQITLENKQIIDTALIESISQMKYADFNGDGLMDMVSYQTLSYKQSLVWVAQTPDHQLSIKHILLTDKQILGIAVADLDTDNDLDLIYLERTTGFALKWLKNDGLGGFQPGGIINSWTPNNLQDQYQLYVVDFENDGDTDVCVAESWVGATQTQKKFWAYENQGNGVFALPKLLLQFTCSLAYYNLADINGDGHFDIILGKSNYVVTSYISQLSVIKNDGANNFGNQVSLTDSILIEKTLVADINSDTHPDIISIDNLDAGLGGGPMKIFMNNGSGTFLSPVSVFAEGIDIRDIRIDDLTNDGYPDIAALVGKPSSNQEYIHLLINNGAGNFPITTLKIPMQFRTFEPAKFFDIKDWNADGNADLILKGFDLYAYEKGNGDFSQRPTIMPADHLDIEVPHTADINKDGLPDIMGDYGERIAYFQQNPDHSFSKLAPLFRDSSGGYAHLADLDKDGDMDIIRPQTNQLVWYQNDGTGHFSTEKLIKDSLLARNVKMIDLDNDDDLDLVFFKQFDNNPIFVMLGDGAGHFVEIQKILIGIRTVLKCLPVDVDGDTDLDILLILDNNTIVLYRNNGSGFLGNQESVYAPPTSASDFLCRDFDGDGDSDIFYHYKPSSNATRFALMRNNGSGSFSQPVAQSINILTLDAYYCYAVDLDVDGDLDILCNGKNVIYWVENTGDGQFAAPEVLLTGFSESLWYMGLGDLDLDGKIDILCTDFNIHTVMWFKNITTPVLDTRVPENAVIDFTMAPNPAQFSTTLTLPANGHVHLVTLFDAHGKRLQNLTARETQVNILRNNLPAGTYFVQVTDATTGKLVGTRQMIWQ